MTTEDKSQERGGALLEDPSRREFVAISAAVGLAAGSSRVRAADAHGHGHVVAKDVQIMTGDGTCTAAYIAPAAGKHPGVIVWTDIFGLRPTMRTIGRRLAAAGYAVLVPDPFYRSPQSGTYAEDEISKVNFQDAGARAKMAQNTGPINAPGAIETDAKAHVAFLLGQKEVNADKKMGTVGFCMGGPLVFQTVASQADHIGAGVTFHGGGLVTDKPNSPHLLIPKFQAQVYCAVAASDDMRQPDAKDKLNAAFKASSVPQVQMSTAVVYEGTFHGWTVPDMPHQANGDPTYNKAEADKAWSHLLSTFRANLA
jgi:carboxymethylenebutenolidase